MKGMSWHPPPPYRVGHRGDVSINARADVLQIKNHHVHGRHHAGLDLLARVLRVERTHVFVNVRHHVGRRLVRLAVKAEHRQLIMFVEIKWNKFAGLGVAAHAVLRTVQRDQLHVRVCAENFNDAIEPVEGPPVRLVMRLTRLSRIKSRCFSNRTSIAEFDRRPCGADVLWWA